MTTAVASRRMLGHVLSRSAHVRGPRKTWEGVQTGHKEWLHFTVHGAGLDLVVNFSLFDSVGRVGCLVRHRRWQGDIDTCAADTRFVGHGGLDLRLGSNQLTFRDGGFDLRVALERVPVSVNLRLEPRAFPAQINNFEVDGVPALNWLVVPRLAAHGWVTVGEEQFVLDGAAAYHDHNWGHFRWGGDLTWEWGYAHAPREEEFSLVLARLSNRARSSDRMRGLFVWKGLEQFRVFSGDELQHRHEGLLRVERPLKLPRVMGLLSQGSACDVPRRYVVTARRGSDRLSVEFVPSDVAQVVVPNDDDFGLTVINECRGDLRVEGRLAGQPVHFEAPSIFEFLSD